MKGPLPDDVAAFLREIVAPDTPMNVRSVAAILGVHYNTVKRISPESLPYFTVGDRGDRRYLARDVRAYVALRSHR